MKQHQINLLPADIQRRNQAGVRTGRYVACTLIGAAVLIAAVVQTRIGLHQAQAAFASARETADRVIETERRSTELAAEFNELWAAQEQYRMLSHPLDLSAIVASVVNRMPKGMSLDRIDLRAGPARASRTSRGGSRDDEGPPPRMLVAELSGFAESDDAIAGYVGDLSGMPPLSDVKLDFSRSRTIRGQSGREFRMSFVVPFETMYHVTTGEPSS